MSDERAKEQSFFGMPIVPFNRAETPTAEHLLKAAEQVTVSQFAAMASAHPEYLDPNFGGGKWVPVAKIHPKHLRGEGDETVICRALVWFLGDEYTPAPMFERLTIRAEKLLLNKFANYHDEQSFLAIYRTVTRSVIFLPEIELAGAKKA